MSDVNITYELVIHSRDVIDFYDTTKHTGYDLITYYDGVPTIIQSVDLYNDNGNIKFDIKSQFVITSIYDDLGIVHGMFANYDGESIVVTNKWLVDNQYHTASLLTDNAALTAFNKIKLEASILNLFSDQLDYDFESRNCNSSSQYFADKYLNGVDVFSDLIGTYVGSSYPFYLPTATETDQAIKEASEMADKFLSYISGKDFDFSSLASEIINSDGSFVIWLSDGINSYQVDSKLGVISHTNEFGETTSFLYPGLNLNYSDMVSAINQDIIVREDPLVLDLDGDGVEIIKGNGSYFFDVTGDGIAEEIDWISSDDGFLIHDTNNDGIVNGLDEMFGNETQDGFDELSTFDSNGDGRVDVNDERFSELKVWRDLNGNGISDAGEVKSLSYYGITGFDLTGREQTNTVYNADVQKVGSVIFEDGSVHDMSDVFFGANSHENKYVGEEIEISADVEALPNLKGFGSLPDLHIAAMKDPVLKGILVQISQLDSNNAADILDLTTQLINRWSGADEVDSSVMSGRMSSQLVKLLSEFSGLVNFNTVTLDSTADVLNKIYVDFYNSVVQTLLVQTVFAGFENYSGEYIADANVIINTSDIDFDALIEEVKGLNFSNDNVLMYNIFQLLNNVKHVQGISNESFEASISDLLDSAGLSYMKDGLINDSYIVTTGINDPVDGISYIILPIDTADRIVTGSGNDYIEAGAGNDNITAGAGDDIIIAGAGNDYISGGAGDDIIIAGAGNDYISGGEGNDRYIFNQGWGQDIINNESTDKVGQSFDVVEFGEGISAADIDIIKVNYDLILQNKLTGDYVRICGYFENGGNTTKHINEIKFSDGTSWTYDYLRENWRDGSDIASYGIVKEGTSGDDYLVGSSGNDFLLGGKGNDSINAGAGDDIIFGDRGNDYLDGGAGNDTYLYNLGDGFDTIYDTSGNDVISFGVGIYRTDIRFKSEGYDLIINIKNNPSIKITSFFYSNYYKIEKLIFADGSFIDLFDSGLVLKQDNTAETIYGTDYDDVIYADGGKDTVYAGSGNDTIYGRSGNDYLDGGYGNDTYVWNLGDGFDTIYDSGGNDTIKFGEGITFEDLEFKYVSGDLRIVIKGDTFQGMLLKNFFGNSSYKIENIVFDDGSVFPLSETGLTLVQDNLNESILGTPHDDTIYSKGGNDTIDAGNGNDTLIGGTGNDTLYGGYGDDTYIWNLGDGFDTIQDYDGNDKIKFGEGISFEDLTFEQNGSALRIYVKGDKTQGICISYQFSSYKIETLEFADGSTFALSTSGLTLTQSNDNDNMYGTIYDDTIYGNGGNDIINLTNGGNNTIIGGTGNDDIRSGYGNDTYIWNLGDGFDTIMDYGGNDKIKFGEGISFEDLTFEQNGSDLRIYVKGDKTQGMCVSYQFSSSGYYIETLEFADGSTFGLSTSGLTLTQSDDNDNMYGTAYDDTIYGNGGNDTIDGGNGNDTIIGGTGNDTLNGSSGDDIYIWNLGDGFDTIRDTNGTDKIKFGEGITFENLTFEKSGSDLKIYVKGDKTQGACISYQFSSYQIETLEFADGSTFALSTLGLTLTQSDDNDNMYGTPYDDIIHGNGGNDTIDGGNGNDTIIGGTGNDTLNDSSGDDTYIWNLGDGFDTITESSGNDKIIFGEGITFEDLTFEQKSSDLKIYVKGDKTQGICISSQFSSYPIETLEFADGSVFGLSTSDLAFIQTDANNNISGTSYDDTIYGSAGNDTINAGNGNDTIIGGTGDDKLYGSYGNDTYIWNLGDGFDTIQEYGGNDKIIFGAGITFEDLTFERDGNDLKIYIKGDRTQGIYISSQFYLSDYQIETLEFADGSTFGLSTSGLTFTQTEANDNISGTSYDDIIYGNGGNDTIDGGNGNNILIGGIGDDKLYGKYGDDTYIWNLGDGFDTITDYGGNDKIIFGEGITFEDLTFEQNGSALNIYVKGDKTQGFCISSQFSSSYQIDTLEFADGSTFNLSTSGLTLVQTDNNDNVSGTAYDDIIYGNGGNDAIGGGNGNDVLIGGAGDDKLYGGYGDDTYIWNLGDGFDTITDYGGNDKIIFGEGISLADLTFERDGNNLKIYIKGDKTQGVYISSQFSSSYQIDTLEFADGSTFNLSTSGLTLIQTDNNDSVSGTAYDDIIYGNGGNDAIDGGNGNDVLIGGAGDDKLYGGYGDDTYIWNLGDGFDTISDYGGNDKIVFGEGISFEDLTFEKDGSALNIYVKGDKTQGICILPFFNGFPLDALEFADGSTFNLLTSGFTFTQTDLNDNISGTAYDDIIYGNGGYDTINGGYGNDTLIGGTGDDTLDGGYGNDTYVYNLGDGFDTIQDYGGNDKIIFGEGININDLSVSSSGNDLILKIKGDNSSGMKISNQFGSSSYMVETLEFANGSMDISQYTSADQLIQAIAGFGAASAATTDMTIEELNIIDNVVAGSYKNVA